MSASSNTSISSPRDASTPTSSVPGLDTGVDPAVIVGLACRVPGALNPSQLWENILAQKDVQRQMPEGRFNVEAFYHPDGTHKGTTNAKYGYFLDDDVGLFDPGFFNISGKEAEAMDPQQRLLLEVVYEALENAGITLSDINGSQTAVFCGSFTNDYNSMVTKDLEYYPKYTVTGTGNAILSNRISYFYNLHGPSVTIDTACSSSLVCFHLGSQSLLTHESEIAIVVGSALHFDPNIFITMTDLGMLSTDGRCRAFDQSGSGYVRGEGICAAVLKRKSQAELQGDPIRAIVRATAANHDGRKQGITLPSAEAQEELIRTTYEKAGLNPADTTYFEAHGTGTAAGDPREARAIGAVFAPGRTQPLLVGSVKTNIGHLEGASGLAGIIKATLCLEHGTIAPNMHFKTPNPSIPFDEWKIQVPTQAIEWPQIPEESTSLHAPRRASINSFGYGGTNAHVILEAYCPVPPPARPTLGRFSEMVKGRPFLLPLTSHSEKAGKLMACRLLEYLQLPQRSAEDVAFSLSTRRSMHGTRSFALALALARSPGEQATRTTKGLVEPGATKWTAIGDKAPRVGFVFTGQGAQWFAMGRQLIQHSPLFMQTLERCDSVLQQLPPVDRPSWSVVAELARSAESSRLGETRLSQPICTALQLALVDLLGEWAITPSAVVGHSSGEMAAAYAAGILSFENALRAAYYRGLHMSNTSTNAQPRSASVSGAMMAVGLTEPEATAEIQAYEGRISIAAINSPASITVSGDEDAILELKAVLDERKVFARKLQVAQAFHSHHMIPLAPAYEKALENCDGFAPHKPHVRMFSSVTARVADYEAMGAPYWTANMTGTVRFSDALTGILLDELDNQAVEVLMEVGPHPALKGPSRQVLQSLKLDIPYISTLTRGEPDYDGLLTTAGQLFALGYPVDLEAANSDHLLSDNYLPSKVTPGRKLRNLPTYAWDHNLYWSETRFIKEHRLRKHRHSFLGALIPGSITTHPRWRNYLRPSELPWVSHHIIEGKTIFPAAGYISMAIEAIIRLESRPADIKHIALRDVSVKSALTVSEKDVGTEVILEMKPVTLSAKRTSSQWYEFAMFSFDENDRCNEHCRGLISAEEGQPSTIVSDGQSCRDLRKISDRTIAADKYYQTLDSIGLQYGESFRLVSGSIETGPGFAMAPLAFDAKEVATHPTDYSILHPTILDAAFHPIFAAIESVLGQQLDEPYVPTFLRSMTVAGTLVHQQWKERRFQMCTTTTLPGPRVAFNNLRIQQESSDNVLVDIQGLELTALGADAKADAVPRSLFFRTRWELAFDFLGSNKNLPEFQSVGHVANVFAHQHPGTKILQLTTKIEAIQDVLRHLGGREGERRRCRNLTPFSLACGQLQDRSTELLKAEFGDLVQLGDPTENEYDLVIVGEEASTIDIVKYLKPDGFVITDGESDKFDVDKLENIFQSPQYSAWKMIYESLPTSGPLTLVLSPNPSKRTEAIVADTRAAYPHTVTTMTLADIARGRPTSNDIVVLSSLDDDLFFDAQLEDEECDFHAAQKLLVSTQKNIVWILEGATMDSPKPEHAIVFGLARVARSENEDLRLVILDLPWNHPKDRTCERLLQALDPRIVEEEITERDGSLFIPRIEADDTLNSKLPRGGRRQPKMEQFGQDRALALKIGKVGLLETLVFDDDEKLLNTELADDEVEIKVEASAINFRDVAASMGIIDDYKLGDECAGFVTRAGASVSDLEVGDKVVALRPGQGAHCTYVRNPAALCYKLQGEMSFAVAAALPCILATAYYALVDVARLQPGETVLIHAAAGGVGQMAVQVAQMLGAKVFATVGSQAKRDLLKNEYNLPDSQIFYSRDASFVEDVLKATNARGVDAALNSLAGPLLHATWSCIAPFGRFIEIGKRDIHENAKIDMDPFRKNVLFASVDLITMYEKNKPLASRVFRECCQLVHEAKIKPPVTVVELSYAEAEKGFRLLQMGKHTGKVVLVPNKHDMVPVLPPTYRNMKLFSPNKTYLLVGGLGGIGRTLAEWMVRKGARSLAFLSRSGADRPEAKSTVEWLETRGIKVMVAKADVTDYTAVKTCTEAIGMTLGGIFQAAMVLQDSPLENMTYKQWQRCMYPKVRGAQNLHKATEHVPLDFFICFSSASDILGSKAQANYAAANLYLDALMRHRRELGLKGTTMNCGMIIGVGAVAEDAALQAVMERIGYDPVNEEELLYLVEEAVLSDTHFFNTRDSAPKVFGGIDEHQIITGINLSRNNLYWAEKPLCRMLYANHDFDRTASGRSDAGKNPAVLIRAATCPEERTTLLMEAFIEKIAAVLAVPAESILGNNPLSTYGLDSIVAVEFRKWFAKTVGVELSLFDVLGSKSISALVGHVAGLIVTDAPEETKASGDNKATGGGEAASNEARKAVSNNSIPKSSITNIERPENMPLSSFQSRLWFAHNLAEDKSVLNLQVNCFIKGKPSVPIVQQTLEEMKRRNDILRTGYSEGEDFSEQNPSGSCKLDLMVKDVSFSSSPHEALIKFVGDIRRTVLSIEDGEVMKVALVKLSEEEYAMAFVFHHIAIDRGSSEHFLDQFSAIYDAIKAQKPISTVPLPRLLYGDFTLWHNERLESAAVRTHIEFWKQKFHNTPSVSALLPFAKSARPPRNDFRRAIHRGKIASELMKRMKRICTREGTTPFQFLLAAFRVFLYRYTEENDLTILMIDGNRPHPDFEEVLGFFVNMVPIRCITNCDTSFDSVLGEIKKLTLEAMGHNQIPFDAIVDAVGAKKSPSHSPLGQVVINYQMHGKIPKKVTKDFEIYDVVGEDIPSACEMNLEALEDPVNGLDLRLEYSSTLYGSQDMDRFFDNFLTFMSSVIQDHRQPCSEIDMCGHKELQTLRRNFWAMKHTENPWGKATVLGKIMDQATTNGHAVAVVTSDGEEVSYEELVGLVQRIADTLNKAGAKPDKYIGVYSRPGIQAVAAMLAVLMNRCGYVAMDPDFATERLAFMATDSEAEIVLVGDGLEGAANDIKAHSGCDFKLININSAVSSANFVQYVSALPDDPFYIVYTSGSTGKPKGVVLRERNTQQMLSTLQKDYGFTARDRFLHQSSICFDLSVVQIFSALTAGATICIASPETRRDPSLLAKFMQTAAVTVTYFTPTQFALLLEYANGALRQCKNYRVAYFAGERLPVRVVKAFYNLATPATAYNTWSPSELVVQTAIHSVEYPEEGTTSIPIGRPCANCRHYIVDAKLHPVPAGVIGELCIGGAQVGAGYLKRPVETSLSFLIDPFCSKEDHERGWTTLFRTGDKGKFRSDGLLEFHGRIAGDKQVKLRGFRIDLGEVEHKLYIESSTHDRPGLVDVSVVARTTNGRPEGLTDDRQLIAFLVPKRKLSTAEQHGYVWNLHQKISQHLNEYMLPNGYQFLDRLPVTIGGKVDRQNLLSQELNVIFPTRNPNPKDGSENASATRADSSTLETVTTIFKEVLKLKKDREIEPTSTFFELGGHSILLLRLQARLKKAFAVSPALADLFRAPTPEGVSHTILSKSPSTGTPQLQQQQPGVNKISWEKETTLPSDSRYQHRSSTILDTARANITPEILLTGVDSFIGLHMLSTLLAANPATTINVIPSQAPQGLQTLIQNLKSYNLITDTNKDDLLQRICVVPGGSLARPQLGLDKTEFEQLGQKIKAIYHLGGEVSLLKSYTDLKPLNVSAALDIIHLASLSSTTKIHHLSTWSVPHLQSWTASTSITTKETAASSFAAPPESDEYGYFKSRWVTEMLMESAANRGFDVTVYRASAVTGSTKTNVAEPAGDIVRAMVLGMVGAGVVPRLHNNSTATSEFVVDLIPVDFLTETLHILSNNQQKPNEQGLKVYHITNPNPLPLENLAELVADIRGDGTQGTVVELEDWLQEMMKEGEGERLRWEVLKHYFEMGHRMFALDLTKTKKAVQEAGGSPMEMCCPPVDARYLGDIWKRRG